MSNILYLVSKILTIVLGGKETKVNASFEERSAWVQLVALLLVTGGYVVGAGTISSRADSTLMSYLPLFVTAVVLLIVLIVIGHIVASVFGGAGECDERDKLIVWRSESNASWVLGAGAMAAIGGLVFEISNIWIAHGLLISLLLSALLKLTMQLVYYRRGV